MATKVSSIYVEPIAVKDTAVDNNPASRGSISAYCIVQARSFNGTYIHKRVRIGVEFGVTVETAKDMMRDLRNANNNEPNISGRFIMDL